MRSYALGIVGKWNTRVLRHALAFSRWRFKRGDRAHLPAAHHLRSGGSGGSGKIDMTRWDKGPPNGF